MSFLLLTLIWGSTWLVIKGQLGVVPASWSVAWRFLIGSAAMTGMCRATGRSLRLDLRGHGFAVLIGVLQFVCNFNLVYRAEQHVSSGLVALVYALMIVPNAVLAALFLRHRITPLFAIGSLMGIAGVGMIVAPDLAVAGAGAAAATGLALAGAGVLCASIANVLQAGARGHAQPLEAGLAWAMGYGGVFNAAFAWTVAGPPAFDMSPGYMAGLLYLGIVASAVAFRLYYGLIRAIGPGRAAYSGVMVPIVAMALSTAFEGYHWTLLAIAGAGLAMAGLLAALRGRG